MKKWPLIYLLVGTSAGIAAGITVTFLYMGNIPPSSEKLIPQKIEVEKVKSNIPKRKKRKSKSKEQITREAQQDVQQSIRKIEKNIAQQIQSQQPKEVIPIIDVTVNDTDSLDSSPPAIILNTDDIVVKKEVLLQQLTTKVVKPSSSGHQTPNKQIDSLLHKNSNIKTVDRDVYKIEYWESPIHYKGYKLANNKLVLYGLEPDFKNQLVLLEDHLYFRHETGLFLIEPTFNSKPFKMVNDELIIQQLEEL